MCKKVQGIRQHLTTVRESPKIVTHSILDPQFYGYLGSPFLLNYSSGRNKRRSLAGILIRIRDINHVSLCAMMEHHLLGTVLVLQRWCVFHLHQADSSVKVQVFIRS